jgi:hypothetical protein
MFRASLSCGVTACSAVITSGNGCGYQLFLASALNKAADSNFDCLTSEENGPKPTR